LGILCGINGAMRRVLERKGSEVGRVASG